SGVFAAGTDEVKSVTEGDSVTLNTDVQVQSKDQILWTFNGTPIAEIHRLAISYGNIEKFRDRHHLDNQTGSLTIKNISKTHAGLYKVEIIRSSGTTEKKFNVHIYDHPPSSGITSNSSSSSGSSSSSHNRGTDHKSNQPLISLPLLLLLFIAGLAFAGLVVAGLVVLFCHRKEYAQAEKD
ncbi:hypothetical protein F2P79_016265, partial [Pimephales promelas]